MLSLEKLEQQINQYEYLSHWVSLSQLQSKLTQRKPFVKLRKFDKKNFCRKHEITLNHLFLQRLYLILTAYKFKLSLQVSQNYYQSNGLIFMIYNYKEVTKCKKLSGIQMNEQFQVSISDDIFQEIIKPKMNQFLNFVTSLKFNPQDQYIQWKDKMSQIDRYLKDDIDLDSFLNEFEKLPLTQHYIYNVKLRNALIMPTILNDNEILLTFKSFVEEQQKIIQQALSLGRSIQDLQVIKSIQSKIFNIFDYFVKKSRIAQLKVFQSRSGSSSKIKQQKQNKQIRMTVSFLVILSPSRSKATIQQKTMQIAQQKDNKTKRYEIKSQNSSIAPVSGNVVNVSITWELYPSQRNQRTIIQRIQCYNNRKLEYVYYEEVEEFWNKLYGLEDFRDMIGIDKYSMTMNQGSNSAQKNQNQKVQVMFMNFIPGGLFSSSIKQIDKIVSLVVAMDQVIQICERKGSDRQDPRNFQIQGYMIQHTKQRFRRALRQIENNDNTLIKLCKNK